MLAALAAIRARKCRHFSALTVQSSMWR